MIIDSRHCHRCGVCDCELVKKNLSTHFQRRHPDKSISWNLTWAPKNDLFKKAHSKRKENCPETDEQNQENTTVDNSESQNIAESNIQNLSSQDCLDDRAVKRTRYDDEKSITDVLQAVQSKCHIIYI